MTSNSRGNNPRDHDQPDSLRQRMRQADPARMSAPADARVEDLVTAAIAGSARPSSQARRWAPVLVAAAAVALIAGAAYVISRDTEPSMRPPAALTTASLAVPGGDSGPTMQSCVPFEVRYLRDVQTAFSGTAVTVGDDRVTIEVDQWYRGGDADLVELTAVDPQTSLLLDGFEFVEGERYLVTANDGTVNLCGFSGPWSDALAASYAEAFGEEDRTAASDDPARREGEVPFDGTYACVRGDGPYLPEQVLKGEVALDGTITKVEPSSSIRGPIVTVRVEEWFRGGTGPVVRVQFWPPETGDDGTRSYDIGSRLLISGDHGPGSLISGWPCGATRYYDPGTADRWRELTR